MGYTVDKSSTFHDLNATPSGERYVDFTHGDDSKARSKRKRERPSLGVITPFGSWFLGSIGSAVRLLES